MGVENDFYDIWIADLRGVLDGRSSGDHLHGWIIAQATRELVNQARGDKWLIALHIDDDAVVWKRLRGLGDAIRAAGVIRVGKYRLSSERRGDFSDAGIIGSDNDVVDLLAFLAALPDMLDERFASYEMKRFAREAGAAPACWDGDESAGRVSGGQSDR